MVLGSGFKVWGSGFGVSRFVFGVSGFEIGVQGVGFEDFPRYSLEKAERQDAARAEPDLISWVLQGLGFGVLGLGSRDSCSGCRVSRFVFSVSGLRCREYRQKSNRDKTDRKNADREQSNELCLTRLGRLFLFQHAGFAVQNRQLWRGKEPGLTRLACSNRRRKS